MVGPGTTSRGRGGKFKKYTRGGGHSFSRNLQPIDGEGNAISMWSPDAKPNGEEGGDDEEEEEDSSDEDSDAGEASNAAGPSRDARKAQKKARRDAAIAKSKVRNVEAGDMPSSDEDEDSDEDDDMPANPNHSKAARKQAEAPRPTTDDVEEITDGVAKIKTPASRKERESMEAAAAKEKYMKLHTAGKTDEAKADLARLRVIREQRAAEAGRKQAEKEEREEQEKTRRGEIEAKEAKKREAAAGPKKASKKK